MTDFNLDEYCYVRSEDASSLPLDVCLFQLNSADFDYEPYQIVRISCEGKTVYCRHISTKGRSYPDNCLVINSAIAGALKLSFNEDHNRLKEEKSENATYKPHTEGYSSLAKGKNDFTITPLGKGFFVQLRSSFFSLIGSERIATRIAVASFVFACIGVLLGLIGVLVNLL